MTERTPRAGYENQEVVSDLVGKFADAIQTVSEKHGRDLNEADIGTAFTILAVRIGQ